MDLEADRESSLPPHSWILKTGRQLNMDLVDGSFEVGKSRKRKASSASKEEEDTGMNKHFKSGKKKKNEKSPAELSMIVEDLMAEFEVTVEEDAELNRQNKPAINKLKKLPLLIEVLSKKELQLEFLDHGVLTLLKSWLEPLPDGSLPNMNVRTAILKLLSNFPIDLKQDNRREQLKKSVLGKAIMFLSKSDEETTANRMLAKELVEKWSRSIFNNSTRFEDIRGYEDERISYRRPVLKPLNKPPDMDSRGYELDDFFQGKKLIQTTSRQHASRPEALLKNYLVNPKSSVFLKEALKEDHEEVYTGVKPSMPNQHHLKINKKLQQLKALKKKPLQALKLSAEGRGMIRYL